MAGTNLRIKQGSEQKDGELWEWWIWLDGPDDELNKVQRVVYTITDPTFPESSRAISDRSNKFMFKNSGWTEFQVLAQIQNKDGTRITLNHNLQLVKQPLSEKHSGLTLCIPGGREKTTEPFVSESTRAGVLKVEALQSVSVESSRAGSEPIKIPDVPDDTVVQIELEGGIRLWTRVDQLREDLGEAGARGAATGELVITPSLRLGPPSRGLGALAIKGLNFFNVHPEAFLAKKLCNFWEEKTLTPEPGFYRLDGNAGHVKLVPAGKVPTDRVILVFIHGTASNTEGSFSELWNKPEDSQEAQRSDSDAKTNIWTELRKIYGDHIYGLQHRTLTVSPIQNALDLIAALPVGARVHLVSHSRGGLVGELVCRGNVTTGHEPFDSYTLNLLTGDERKTERRQLEDLNSELPRKQLRIERFVRVACPSRGTSLASGRLDQFFSLLANVAGRTAPATVGSIVEFFTDVAVAVAKERTDPKVLPGLEAMIPNSPIVRMLNTLPAVVDSDLFVIGGDVEASGVLGTLATVITDVFLYDDDHDLVVDTRYMFGGAPRKNIPRFMFDHGGKVNHFSYFKNENTARQLLRGLKGEKERFKDYEIGEDEIDERFYRKRGAGPMPIVFVLPGFLGSHLRRKAGDLNNKPERIWLDSLKIAEGGLVEKLYIGAPDVEADALLAWSYKNLIEFLAQSHEIRPFPYDWRKSLVEAGDRLAAEIAEALNIAENSQPPQAVRIIAHSTGGLVARSMISRHPDIWQRMCRHNDSRLVMLGTPNGGSLFVARLLLGEEKIIRQLALLDIRHSSRELVDIVAAFPGLLETLPEKIGELDFFDPALWTEIAELGCAVPTTAALTAANSVRAQISAAPLDPKHVVYVAGLAAATPNGIKLDASPREITFFATPRGDGRVPWDSGIPQGIQTWYIPAEHGDMADHKEGFEGFRDLLEKGTTQRLSRIPLLHPDAVRASAIQPPETLSAFPDASELSAAAIGGSSRRQRAKTAPALKISVGVTHGDLAFVDDPVAVGHYTGDTIVSAEGYLDSVLDGRLRKRLALNLYPGPLDTIQVFLSPPGRKPGGAIVVGLGQVGDLTPGKLSHVFARAVLEYALAREESSTGSDPIELKLTSVLIGTGAGGFSVEQSVTSILRGVVAANAMLQSRNSRGQLKKLEFIELYEDLAILASRALRAAIRDPELTPLFQARPLLGTLIGGRYRAVHEEPPGWWNRLIVNETVSGELRFTAPTERARTEVALVATQRAAADRFLSEVTSGTRTDTELGGTLFELLVPNALKDLSPDKRHLVLLLDGQSARFPWEMMFDPLSPDHTPLAVQAGLLRQFETQEFREHPVRAIEPNALVVGDPDSKLSQFPRLPGAKAEAQAVAQILGQNAFSVNAVIEQDSGAVLRALFARPYRIVHLAGHGVFEYCPDEADKEHQGRVTGMVLGPNVFLTAAVIQQMRRVPEFVFINCCHLGNTSGEVANDRHRLAANLATELIRMGVRAIIAAGWEVDDRAALTFARRLYQELVHGTPFGKAVWLARKETHEAYNLVNTWGAYQAYGDPDFTLVAPSSHSSDERERAYVSAQEPIADLRNIVSRAKTDKQNNKEHLGKEIDEISRAIQNTNWSNRADLRAALGEAYFEVGDLEQAIEHYTAALIAPDADVSMRAVEQLANAEVRLGARLIGDAVSQQDVTDKDAFMKGIRLNASGKSHLKPLIDIAKTGERLSLYGGACKRAVLTAVANAERQQALQEMQLAYEQAADLKLERNEIDTYYPLIGWMDATILLAEIGKQRNKFDDRVQQARLSAQREESLNPNFWNRVAGPDLDLRQRLADRDLDERVNDVAEAYRDVLKRYGSEREKDSVLSTLRFFQKTLAAQGDSNLADAVAQLNKLIAQE